jgi:predicted outer membrane protein
MQNNKVLKRLLTVATVAAMFSAFGVHAQTSGSSGTTSASGSGQDATTATGKTTREGTAGSSDSRGTDERVGGAQGSTQGSTSSQGTMGSSAESTANPAVSGTGGVSAGAGATTREGTVGASDSQGMESRQPSKGGSSSGMSSGSSGQGATAGGSAAGGTAAAGGESKGSVSKADEKIIKDMAQANISEIEAGKIAQSKSQNDQVKSFAQQMIDDHSKALSELQTLAQQKGVTLPTEPDAKHKAMATKLQALSGDAFDKAYMAQAGVADHKKVHSMLMSDEKRAKDPDVKAAATKMAPVVEQHLKSAQQVSAVKSGTTSGK